MPLLIGATILLIASHLLPSAPRVRARLMGRLGRGGFFYASYSLLSLLALGFVVWAYRAAEPGPFLYAPPAVARSVALAGMLLAAFLLVGRLTTRPVPGAPVGIYRVSAVPGSLALVIWAVVHLLNRGEARLVVIRRARAARPRCPHQEPACCGTGLSTDRLAAVRDRARGPVAHRVGRSGGGGCALPRCSISRFCSCIRSSSGRTHWRVCSDRDASISCTWIASHEEGAATWKAIAEKRRPASLRA